MEYVDNSLDDAEALYVEDEKSYSRPIQIMVEVNRQKVQEPQKEDAKMLPNADVKAAADLTSSAVENTVKVSKKVRKKKIAKVQETWITDVTVTDNCRGMDKATLNRLIVNVGDSSKRGSKFTNGHFGFGVHAFRACAKRLEFWTKQEGKRTLGLEIDRDHEYFSKPKYVGSGGVETEYGTIVKVSDFDNTWSEQLNPKEIIKEIQHHFSGLLERKKLTLIVKNKVTNESTTCKPFLFDNFKVNKAVEKELKCGDYIVHVRLFVANVAQQGKNCMFVSMGRRVNEVSDVKSFMKMSRCRWAVWGHPNLLGYIDVTHVLEPVITRDEFRLTTIRKLVYRKIIEEVEPVLYKALHEVNENRKVLALAKLEDVVARCVNTAVKKDLRRQEDGLSYLQQMMVGKKPSGRKTIDEDFDVENPELSKKRKRLDDKEGQNPAGGEKKEELDEEGKPKKKRKLGLGFRIAFVKNLSNETTGEPCRARLVGEDMQINMKHPDFLTRIKINKSDHQPMVTERLCGYLSNVIAAAYKSYAMLRGGGMERYKDNHSILLDEILDITLSLETHLRSKLKLMQREMESGVGAATANRVAQVKQN